ncbi:MAG: YkgJ family cysteine cluster protein [bacterium]
MFLNSLPSIPADLQNEYIILEKLLSTISDNIEFLEKIYEYLDKYNKFVKTFTACKQSCGYCCDIPVGITILEAEYIKTYNKKLRIDTHYLHPLKLIKNQKTGKYFRECPFLNSQNDCSIYKARPFACRTFHSIDGQEFCKNKNVDHKLYGTADPESMAHGKVNLGSDILNGLFMVIQKRNKNNIVKDLKDFFPSK